MRTFAADVWHDLRQKRLLPVAAVLVIALVAIPVVLLEPSHREPAAAPLSGTSQAPPAVAVEVADEPLGQGSTLGVFDPKDPFKPRVVVDPSATDGVAEPVDDGGGSAGGGAGSPDTKPTSPPRSEPAPPATPAPPRSRTESYEYVADVTFWGAERRQRRSGMRRLDILPSEASPLLIFMGVTGEGGNAVFLVDSTLRSTGEGQCRPSGSNCAFVHVGPGAEQMFTDEEGNSFRLRVEEIRRVEVRSSSASRRRANASSGPSRRFAAPILPDVVVETETVPGAASSTPGTGR